MDLKIASKNAIVLGASRGLGKAVATALAAEGANLMLVARSEDKLRELAASLKAQYEVNTDYLAIDLAEDDSHRNIIEQAHSTLGKITILVNITGGPNISSALETPGENYTDHFLSMATPIIDLSRILATEMVTQGWGRIITISSSGVTQTIDGLSISNTVRSSLIAWNKTLSNEVAQYGVTVNSIIPGRIHTERVDEIDAKRAESLNIEIKEVQHNSHKHIPMKRYGTVEELSATVCFLASEQASYITGSTIRVDGGLIKSI